MKRWLFVPVLTVAVVGMAGAAGAQVLSRHDGAGYDRPGYYDARQSYYDSRRAAYDTGFREGAKQGEKDARKGEPFSFQDERTFQRADKGYHRQYGDVERYRQAFRSGYASGYEDSYRRLAPRYGNGRYGNGRYGNGRYGDDRNGNYPRGDGRYDTRPGYGGGSYSPAFDNGVNDGYEKGAEDARKNRSYDVLRHEWYREGDRHYEGRYGSREQYKDVYREGFKEGYARGFREGRYR